MKRFLVLLLSLALIFMSALAFGCKKPEGDAKLSLYAPDGAPALSVARLLHDDKAVEGVDVKVVSANVIQTYVTGANPTADFCIMPVNAASKLLGSANNYQMLGVVTHGNLFLMKKQSSADINTDNLDTLKGKKVGVLNMANVPGLTFKAILNDFELDYVDITSTGTVDSNKVNLVALTDGTVTPSADCDYFVVPEPAATTKQNETGGKLQIAASLQALYGFKNGGQTGFPQAVLVAKKTVIQQKPSVVSALINSFVQNASWLTDEGTTTTDIVNAVKSGFVDKEMGQTFNANNLSPAVIQNCAISFKSAAEEKTAVLVYLAKLNTISNNAWGTPVDTFFYTAD